MKIQHIKMNIKLTELDKATLIECLYGRKYLLPEELSTTKYKCSVPHTQFVSFYFRDKILSGIG